MAFWQFQLSLPVVSGKQAVYLFIFDVAVENVWENYLKI